jgi:Peptidase family S41
MNKVLILILFTWTTTTGQGLRRIPVDELVNDFKILKTTIQEIHPDLYRYTSKAVLDREFDSLLRTINTELTEVEFYQKVAPWVALIKNGHTAIRLPDSYYSQIILLPLRLVEIDKRIYIKTDFSDKAGEHVGFEIIRVNDISIEDIMRRITPYVSLDGFNEDAKYKAAVEDDFAYYYSYVFGQSEYFELELRNPRDQKEIKKRIKGISNTEFNFNFSQDTPFPWTIRKVDTLNAVLLRIGSFNNHASKAGKQLSFKSFLKQTFDEIKEQKVENLIIDLRNNGGGELKNSILLYSYLTDSPFQFTKEIEIATVSPPTYIQYTDYSKALKFDSFEPKNVIKRDSNFILAKHFSMETNKPIDNSFSDNLYVIINGQTGSSAGSFTACVHNEKRGKIIGEPNRDNYTGFSAGVPVTLTLPNSKIKIYIPLRKFTYATGDDNGKGVIPDYPFSITYSDYFNGDDAEVKYVTTLVDGINKASK